MFVIDYTPAVRQTAGIGRIIRGQIQALIDLVPGTDLRLFVNGHLSADDRHLAPLPLAGTPLSERNMVRLWHRLNSPWPPVERFTGGPIDLFHATDFVLAPSKARRKVVTVHDLAFLFYPEAAMPSLERYLNVVVRRSVDRADHVIADSANTATDLTEQWGVDPTTISVVQGAVDHFHFHPVPDLAQQQTVRERYAIGDGPFILGLSKLQPRKNFARLIQAFALAKREGNLPHRLIIGGSKGWLFDQIFATAQELGVGDAVHFPGFIRDGDLPALYSAAQIFAYPSLYEGFGLPILEAMACGTPVLTGDNSCLPEAGGEAALYVDAEDVESMAAGLLRLADDGDLRAQMGIRGVDRAAQFTWARSATQLWNVYERVMG